MWRTIRFLVALSLLLMIANTALAATNDDFPNATTIETLPFSDTQSTAGTSVQGQEPPPCGVSVSHTIWYRFTPSVTQSYDLWPIGDVASALAIYTGPKIRSLTPVRCGAPNNASLMNTTLQAGTVYSIQVGSSSDGSFGLFARVTPPPPPPPPPPANDEPSGARELAWDDLSVDFFDANDGATVSSNDPDPGCTTVPIQDTVWFKLTAGDAVSRFFEISSFSFNPFVAVYVTGPGGTPVGPAIACAQSNPDAFPGGDAQTAPTQLLPGTMYLIQVGSVSSQYEGQFWGHIF